MRAIQSIAASIKNYATYFDLVHECPSTITGIIFNFLDPSILEKGNVFRVIMGLVVSLLFSRALWVFQYKNDRVAYSGIFPNSQIVR